MLVESWLSVIVSFHHLFAHFCSFLHLLPHNDNDTKQNNILPAEPPVVVPPPELWLTPLPHQYLGVTSRTFHSIQCSQDGYPPITLSSVLPIFMQNIRHVRQVSSASCHSPDPRVPQVSISSDADTIVRGVAGVHSSDTGHRTRGRCTQTLQHFPWRGSSSTLQQHSHPTSGALLMEGRWCVPHSGTVVSRNWRFHVEAT